MKTTPRSRLLLIELVCDLVIFAFCAVVCVALLVQAKSMSAESTRLTQAVYIAQDAAERLRSGLPPQAHYRADGTPAEADAGGGPPDYSVTVDYVPDGSGALVSVYRYQPPEVSFTPPPVYTLTVAGEVAP